MLAPVRTSCALSSCREEPDDDPRHVTCLARRADSGAAPMTKVDKLELALDAGQLWPAKETLAGRIGSGDFTRIHAGRH